MCGYSDIESILSSMQEMNITQRTVVSWLKAEGYYPDMSEGCLRARVNMALKKTRTTDAYQSLIKEIGFVIYKNEKNVF